MLKPTNPNKAGRAARHFAEVCRAQPEKRRTTRTPRRPLSVKALRRAAWRRAQKVKP